MSMLALVTEFGDDMKMLAEALNTEFGSDDEKQQFISEIVKQSVGDEKQLQAKICRIKQFLDYIDSRDEQLKKAKEQIASAQNTMQNIKTRIKEHTLYCLKEYEKISGKKSIEQDGLTLTYQKNGGKKPLVIEHDEMIDHEYQRYTITFDVTGKNSADKLIGMLRIAGIEPKSTHSPDREKIREEIERGGEVSGAMIHEAGESIRFKITGVTK